MRSFWMIVSVGVSTLFGVMLADRFLCHVRILSDMRELCQMIRMQSICGGGSVLQMLHDFSPKSNAVQAFLQSYRRNLMEQPSQTAWQSALEEELSDQRHFLGVTAQELHLFLQMERVFGSFLLPQQKMLQDIEKELDTYLDEAKKRCRTRGTMCTKLGLLFGIAVAILLM